MDADLGIMLITAILLIAAILILALGAHINA